MSEALLFGALTVRDEAVVDKLHRGGQDDMEISLVEVCTTDKLRNKRGDSPFLNVVEFVADVYYTAPCSTRRISL